MPADRFQAAAGGSGRRRRFAALNWTAGT